MIYEVIVDIGATEVDRIFDYHSDMDIELGSRVLVPFGKSRTIEGFVLGKKDNSNYGDIKDIIRVLDTCPAIIAELLSLTEDLVENKFFRYVDALRLYVPPKMRGGRVKEKLREVFELKDSVDYNEELKKLRPTSKKQRALLTFLKEEGATDAVYLRETFTSSAVKAINEKGLLARYTRQELRTPYRDIKHIIRNVELTEEQKEAVEKIENTDQTRILLHGVTGSGKTEIYMQLISDVLKANKTAIMLVPEISLTPQTLAVFRGRFGDGVAMLHSGLSDGERFDEWNRLLTGKAKVAVGARSAIFAPLKNIGVIIIDEEHDSSYFNDREPRYATEDIAMWRAKYNNAKLVLGSATPSLESYKKAMDNESLLITIKNRINSRPMPQIEMVDMRDELRGGNLGLFSKRLIGALGDVLSRKDQAMIFLNRRGYVSFLRCRNCGEPIICEHCEVSMKYHKNTDKLKCHYCGREISVPTTCSKCGSDKGFREGRIGTEKVIEEIEKCFPDAKVLRMDNDTTGTKDSYLKILTAFREGKADILVGTQMIAKGHDFPNVTLVGILDADLTLYFPDFRSNERTFQLITQVAGRAGRDDKVGRVVLQTYNPKHYVFRFAELYDYRGFYNKECATRENTHFPPFTTIIKAVFTSKNKDLAWEASKSLYKQIVEVKKRYPGIIRPQVLPAPISKINDRYRYFVLAFVWGKSLDKIIKGVHESVKDINLHKELVATVEINPQQMM